MDEKIAKSPAQQSALDFHPLGEHGPFKVIEYVQSNISEKPFDPPRRRYECEHYEECLNIAAALNWDSFTCRGCCGQIDQALFWRAHQALRKDDTAKEICELPEIHCCSQETDTTAPTPLLKVAKG